MAYAGGCQCGRVRYHAEGLPGRASLCYCRMCQKATGAPFMAVVHFQADRVTWSSPPATFASSNIAERGFCAACGTPLYYQEIGGPNVCVTIHSLDDPSLFAPEVSLASERKAPWLDALDALRPFDHGDGDAPVVSFQHPDTLVAG